MALMTFGTCPEQKNLPNKKTQKAPAECPLFSPSPYFRNLIDSLIHGLQKARDFFSEEKKQPEKEKKYPDKAFEKNAEIDKDTFGVSAEVRQKIDHILFEQEEEIDPSQPQGHALRLFATPQVQSINTETSDQETLSLLFDAVFEDERIKQQFEKSQIRYITMCGLTIQNLLRMLKKDPHLIEVLAVGDVALAPEYQQNLEEIRKAGYYAHEQLVKKYGSGYDLASQGPIEVRQAFMNYLDPFYGFSQADPALINTLAKNSAAIPGGMFGLKMIAENLDKLARKKGRKVRFIYGDNVFSTWISIVEFVVGAENKEQNRRLSTRQKNGLHLSPEEIEKFAATDEEKPGEFFDVFYLAGVGNPSGTATNPEQYYQTCRRIAEYAGAPGKKRAAAILHDSVYVRTLQEENACQLMMPSFADPAIRNMSILLESLSKTLGICGERVGFFCAENPEIFSSIQVPNMTFCAGNGIDKFAWLLALSTATPEQNGKIKEWHKFLARERAGLDRYFQQFPELFDEDQSHNDPDALDKPGGIYLLKKLKPGITAKDVALRTRCFGIPQQMEEGLFIRFALSKITEPTYS